MKRHLLSFISILLAITPLLTSCVRDVVLDAGENPQVVVECILTNSDVQELRLNFTKGASQNETEPLTEAVATLLDLTGKFTVGQFEKREGDLWTLNYTPTPMHHYRLEIQVPGYDLICAEDSMPAEPDVYIGNSDVLSLTLGYYGNDREYVISELNRKYYKDKTGKLLFLRGSYYYIRNAVNPFVVYGMNYNPVTEGYEMIEQLCTDHPAVLSDTFTGGEYVPSCKSDEENGMLLHPILEGAPLHRHYMIFPKNADNIEKFFIISGSFTGDWWHTPEKNTGCHPSLPDYGKPGGYLVVASMSNNSMQYLDEALRYHSMQESSDMTSIYLRDNIYNNINGGLGLFAAISEKRLGWQRIYTDMAKWEAYWNSDKYKYIDEYGRYHYEDGSWGYYYPELELF